MSDADERDREAVAQEFATERAKRHLAALVTVYNQSVTSLWIANGGASIAVLSFAAATAKSGVLDRHFLIPLVFFACGLISMGAGTAIFLFKQTPVIRELEAARGPFDVQANRIKRASERAGLSLYDPRTVSALAAAAFFVCGIIVGILELFSCSR